MIKFTWKKELPHSEYKRSQGGSLELIISIGHKALPKV